MVCLQYLVIQVSSTYFTYKYNDTYHFVLHVLLATRWGLEDGFAFNAPIWSVSIEVLMYLLFFYVCLMGMVKKRYLIVMALIGGFLILPSPDSPLSRGLWSFFIGGLVFHGYRWTLEQGKLKLFLRIFLCVLPVLCVLAVMEVYSDLFSMTLRKLFGEGLLLENPRIGQKFVALRLRQMTFTGILFPVMIYTLALLDTQGGKLGSRVSFVGDLSYSSYLLHFPLQLVFVLWIGNNATLFSQTSVFLSYFLILITLSLASHKYFERPVQNAIRRKFL